MKLQDNYYLNTAYVTRRELNGIQYNIQHRYILLKKHILLTKNLIFFFQLMKVLNFTISLTMTLIFILLCCG